MRMLIIGGAGSFGLFYAKLFARHGIEISINDLSEENAKKICKENNFNFVSDLSHIEDFDVVVVSVSNKDAPGIIRKVSRKMKKGSLLFDFCSVKNPIEKELINAAKLDLEIASLHPMHGPRVQNIAGQNVAVIEITKSRKLSQILQVFMDEHATTVPITIREHDEVISIVQGLTHYSQFVSAATIKELGIELKKTTKLTTPNYSLFLSLISRVILQNPEVYSEIQLGNPINKKVRKAFVKSAKELEKICNKNDAKLLAKNIIRSAQEFKEGESFLIESDRAVAAQKYVFDTLNRNIGKKFLVENLFTNTMHYGTIKDIEKNELIITEKHHETRICLQKLRVTTKEEMIAWKEKNLKKQTLDFSFIVPISAEKIFLANAMHKITSHYFEAIDEFSGEKIPQGMKSVTIRATFFEDEDKEKVNNEILSLIKRMGYIIR
jgi:prephenate dehydrogenase/ferredoxin-fold anticodon binding domain-containing protein